MIFECTKPRYFKLPFIGKFFSILRKKIKRLWKGFVKTTSSWNSFSRPSKLVQNMFSTKDFIPNTLKSQAVYKFACSGCNASYIGETNRHLFTRVKEHLYRDKSSHVYKQLLLSENCREINNESPPTRYQLKIKEALHISWQKPPLNKQVMHCNITIS